MTKRIHTEGIECAKPGYIFMENTLILINVIAGFIGMYPKQFLKIPILSIAYAAFVSIMLIFVLRKHLCTQCYYYGKACHCGWGKLAAKLYKEGTGNQKLGGTLAGITWGVLMGIPIFSISILMFTNFSFVGLVCLIVCVITTIINSVLHVKDCKECKMRYECPGSAYKEKAT